MKRRREPVLYQRPGRKRASGDASWHCRTKKLRALGRALLMPKKAAKPEES